MPHDADRPRDGRATALVLDTDIGTDVDDLLALAVLLGSPELEVTAVTTVYGDVDLRARIVARAHAAAHRPAPLIAAGLSATRSGRPVWWAGHEGATIEDLDQQQFAEDASAIDALAEAELVVALGPLTNVAAAVETPGRRIGRLVMMGGAFDGRPEHNIRSDVDAAAAVLDSGIELTTVGLEMTEQIRVTEDDLTDLPGELGALIGAEVRRFWAFTGQTWNNPHDPIAVLTLLAPDLFTLDRGRIRVDPTDHVTRFEADAGGPHRIVRELDVSGVKRELLTRIRRAGEH